VFNPDARNVYCATSAGSMMVRCATWIYFANDRSAVATGGNAVVAGAQQCHASGNLCEPHQRVSPPDLAGQGDDRVCAAEVLAVCQQESHLSHEFGCGEIQERGNARVLQWSDAELTPGQDRGKPADHPSTKITIRVEKQPAFGVPPFSVGKF
jgi:hypothetical protein